MKTSTNILKQVAQRATIAHLRAIIKIWGLFRCSRAANSTVSGPIWLKFDLIQNIMYVLITCKSKKIIGSIAPEKMWKYQFFRHSRIATCNSVVSIQIWPKFKLIQALIYVLITCKYQKDQIKINQETVETTFSPL